jgi:hypothetical protein
MRALRSPLAALFAVLATATGLRAVDSDPSARRDIVRNIPGCVAFWDFVRREETGERRFIAHVPAGQANAYPLDAVNYVRDFWGEGRPATYADFPLLNRGPFGAAIRIRAEADPNFRPLLMVPRPRLHDSPLDLKGPRQGVTVVVWAIRESGNHALAGIWHEGTDLKQASTAGIRRVERGQRQYALFAGLNKEGAACGHVSENGAQSFGHIYAMHKSNSGDVSARVPADSPAEVLDAAWVCFAMTFDPATQEITGWIDGRDTPRWESNVRRNIPPIYNAWRQGWLRRSPNSSSQADPAFPANQTYTPPEETAVATRILGDDGQRRTEWREYRYSRVRVTLQRQPDGTWTESERDLEDVRLNPWWYPHGIYQPEPGQGGPFTIGRVIHSSRSVGFTGWIGGVAVFNRALSREELAVLARFNRPVTGGGQ